jgi:formylglycine-generating enzyme required for sulfatase activity
MNTASIYMSLALLLSVLYFPSVISAQDAPRRHAEPSLASLEASQKLVNEIYRAELLQANTSEQKVAMARKLLQMAIETRNDPSGQYVLLMQSSDLAVQECEASLALICIDHLDRYFEIDLLKRKASVLTRTSRSTSQPNRHRLLAGQFATLLDACLAAERFDIALPLAEIAVASARECKDKIILSRATARKSEITELAKSFEAIKESLADLDKRPLDPAVNLIVGRYHCFLRADWKRGVPMLALGSDLTLKELAILELAERPNYIRLGDGWWELGAKEAASTRLKMRQHAAEFYRLAAPSLTGLSKSKVEARLKELMPTGRVPGERISNSIGMQLAFIPEGEFIMGASWEDEVHPSDKPQHLVRLTQPFYFGIHEVTQEQYQRVMDANPSRFKGKQNPVEKVTWLEAIDFCRRLSALPEERKHNRTYRLPTEAEWEYACRAGTTTRYYFGDSRSQLADHAWYGSNAQKTTHPVGQKSPNAWGLFDMQGNVWEWCADWFEPQYYDKSVLENPLGPNRPTEARVMRGNCFLDADAICYSSRRGYSPPKTVSDCQGFRVVCEVATQANDR